MLYKFDDSDKRKIQPEIKFFIISFSIKVLMFAIFEKIGHAFLSLFRHFHFRLKCYTCLRKADLFEKSKVRTIKFINFWPCVFQRCGYVEIKISCCCHGSVGLVCIINFKSAEKCIETDLLSTGSSYHCSNESEWWVLGPTLLYGHLVFYHPFHACIPYPIHSFDLQLWLLTTYLWKWINWINR